MLAETTVYTVGHGNDTFDAFLSRIQRHGITTIIDVRSQPASRHAPDFRKSSLERMTSVAGIGYRWMGRALGGRPSDRRLTGEGGEPRWDAIAAGDDFRSGIAELIGLTHTGTAAIMCAELEARWCHRSILIAPALTAAGLRVVDILGDGSAAPHQSPLG